MSFFTENDFPGFEKPISIEHSIHHALLANEKVAPLLERLERYEIVEKAVKEVNEKLREENARLREALQMLKTKWEGSGAQNTVSYHIVRAALAGEKKE